MSDRIRVLHVDDNTGFVDLVATFLEREGEALSVVSEHDARAALERLECDTVDCVVSDYDMPGVNGLEFLDAVRERHPNLPFILYTGKGSEEIAAEAISAGVTDYLQKESGTEQYAVLANRVENVVTQFRAKRAVEESERRLTQLAENATDVLWMYSGDWSELLFINSAYEEIYGRSLEALREDPADFLRGVHPGDRERVREKMAALSRGEPAEVEYRVNEQVGYERWVWVQASPVLADDGSVSRIVGFSRDITDRRAREEMLASLHDIAVEIETCDDEDEVYRRTIDAAADLLEFDLSVVNREEDGMLPIAALSADVPPEGASPMSVEEGIVGLTYRTGESLRFDDVREVPEANPQGPYRSGISVPVGDHGVFQAVAERPGCFTEGDLELAELLVSHTAAALDRLERERALREREQRLTRQNERLEQFTRFVSHDLQTPLSVLDGALELARSTDDPEHWERCRRTLDRMERLIDDLLTLARDGQMVESVRPVSLESAVRRAWGSLDSEGATLDVEADVRIEADPDRLRQVLENLLQNALEHGAASPREAGGAVEQEAAATRGVAVRVVPLADGFAIEDDGTGVPPADRATVFEPGFTTGSDGTGFGLSIVDEIAAAHDWTVAVTDGRDGGARFEIRGVSSPAD